MLFNGTTSIIQNTTADLAGGSNIITLALWLKLVDAGESGQGRIFVMDETGSAVSLLIVSTNQLRFTRGWTSAGNWDLQAGTPWAFGSWFGLVIAYDGGSTANDPAVYTTALGNPRGGLYLRTPTEAAAPSGTLTAPGTGWAFGNRADTTRTMNGNGHFLQVWNRALSFGEMQDAIGAPGSVQNGLRLALLEEAGGKDFGRHRHDGVLTAVIKGEMPPVTPWRPALVASRLASAGGGGPASTSNLLRNRRKDLRRLIHH